MAKIKRAVMAALAIRSSDHRYLWFLYHDI